MRIILIGNYIPDQQESMERFALLLYKYLHEAGVTSEIWRPTSFFGKAFKSSHSGLGKWAGYLDKWILFPILIRKRLISGSLSQRDTYFHVCDHSNAPYLSHLPKYKTGITCHDVLAIRGAMGYADAYCSSGWSGKILQNWILKNLRSARLLAADSQNTLDQLLEITSKTVTNSKWRVIHIGFNNDFRPMNIKQREALLHKAGIATNKSFLLCVGSGLPRKNRKLLLDMVTVLGSQWQGHICFAGQKLDSALKEYANTLGLQNRIFTVVKPDHNTLVALYSTCEAFIFPSFSEGFGWPVIEAQACGAPVIASSLEPMPEISGGAALHADPHDPVAFADAFLSLQKHGVRNNLIEKGFVNCARFEPTQMIQSYLSLYKQKPVEETGT